ncbi:type III-B CRISPR module RAMP protein Cmr6 [Spirosoma sordidisoli]|uniref:Type III-B CRISPR module RAMP protein Cmr6 n=1 Tax=Spirosoma sordidisoli TaxID=2502893 RepID=A0A4V1RWF0_9BACT|nr:type III-B CRISPR module RAMP protein Cmr6 [Spirosoma sordidisoli]RYC70038.1 type III-B CRISPR module RAMP protein Cmr6 [Spirosoma sordidisoli]
MPIYPNLHWKYYVDYFREPQPGANPFPELHVHNNAFYEARATQYRSAFAALQLPGSTAFCLHTTYPGLLAGSGYRHETGSENELKLGFSFDFTTGLPILPGSSVKGLLRSAFPGDPKTNPLHNRADGFIRYLLKSPAVNAGDDFPDLFVQQLERELFDGQMPKSAGSDTYVELPMNQRDTFCDGLIGYNGNPDVPETDRVYGGPWLKNDFITPHRNRKNPRMSPFTNPIPIQFLKVMPKVPVTFQFMLPDRPGQLLTPEQRQTLYRAIIEELGVGAKTRVGYGQLV